MTAKVILNPYSGRWTGKKMEPEIHDALKNAGITYELENTTGPNHGVELAEEAVRAGFSPILAAGGDGTLSEVINGMLRVADRGSQVPFGMLPLGTANDLAVNLSWPKTLPEAAAEIQKGITRAMDVLQVNDRYFVNNAGLGLEPFISTIQAKMVRVRGIFRYVLAALRGIASNPKWDMDLVWPEGSYSGPVTMVSIGNCPLTGGVYYTVPHADPFDGKLTFIYGYLSNRWQILRALPKTFNAAEGNISEHPAVHEFHTTELKVKINPATPAHADGEVFTNAIREVKYLTHPGKLQMLVVEDLALTG